MEGITMPEAYKPNMLIIWDDDIVGGTLATTTIVRWAIFSLKMPRSSPIGSGIH